MKNNQQAFSLVMAMWIVILITLLAFMILEYIIPFGRNVKGIENSSKAYYQAQSWIEQALLFQSLETTTTWDSQDIVFTWWPLDYSYDIAWSGNMLPPSWEGNSEYDDESIDWDEFSWNTIAPGQPIQLEIWAGVVDWDNAVFYFRVPNIDTSANEELQWDTQAVVNWQIGSSDDLLSADGTWMRVDQINGDTAGENTPDGIAMWALLWSTLEDGSISIAQFYDADRLPAADTSECIVWRCTLKFSIVNPLLLEPSNPNFEPVQLPYLEWRFDFGNGAQVPLRYAGLKSQGKSYGFQKTLELKIPQQTIVEAFDFTVFQ